jgi:hypothetical protein
VGRVEAGTRRRMMGMRSRGRLLRRGSGDECVDTASSSFEKLKRGHEGGREMMKTTMR